MNENDINAIADRILAKIRIHLQPEELISKYSACRLLGMSRSNFDRLVSIGILPHGIKRTGFKELAWRKNEILMHIQKYKNGRIKKQNYQSSAREN